MAKKPKDSSNFYLRKKSIAKLFEFADKIGRNLEIIRYASKERLPGLIKKNQFTCSFRDSMIKQTSRSSMISLIFERGEGDLLSEAIDDYWQKIKGKILVFFSIDADRRIIQRDRVPKE